MHALPQMGQNQPLPVQRQNILAAIAGQLNARTVFQRFDQKMHIREVAQRLIMSYALDWCHNGLFIQNLARTEGHHHAKTTLNLLLQHFRLHRSHNIDMNFFGFF